MARWLRKTVRPLGFRVLQLVALFAMLFGGLPMARRVGEALGELHFRLGRAKRRDLERQLAQLFPALDASTRHAALRHAYRVNERTIIEGIGMSWRRVPDELLRASCEIDGLEELRARLSSGRGVIVITMHMGNSLMPMVRLAADGFPVSTVYRASRKLPADFLQGLLEKYGIEGISASQRSQAYRAMLRALQQGRILFVLMDQATKFGGTPVAFLGKHVEMPEGPFRLAARTGAPVLPLFAESAAPCWRFSVGAPLDLGDGSAEAGALVVTAAMEAHIRAHPELWSWHHRRWGRYPFLDAVAGD
jgi:lauroyl/myristoyl acyltransferase